MRVVMAGSSGLIGRALCHSFEADGHSVIRLVRRAEETPGEIRWDPAAPPDSRLVDGADVAINLAGAGLGDRRWSRRYKAIMLRSRIEATNAISAMCAQAAAPPAVLISASGMRYYGVDRGDKILTEADAPDSPGFLPMVAQAWEQATIPASGGGIRVCHLRLGLVLSSRGGVLPELLRVFRLGLGGRIGSGKEFWSYVTLPDTIRAIRFLASHAEATGPFNIVTPQPIRNAEFTRALANAVDRPAILHIPPWTLRLALGGIASEVFGSLRVVPRRLLEAGFGFEHPDISSSLHAALRS